MEIKDRTNKIINAIKTSDVNINKIIDENQLFDYHDILIAVTELNDLKYLKMIINRDNLLPDVCLEICIKYSYTTLLFYFIENIIKNNIILKSTKNLDEKGQNNKTTYKLIKYLYKYNKIELINKLKTQYKKKLFNICKNEEVYWSLIGYISGKKSTRIDNKIKEKIDKCELKANKLLNLLGRSIKYDRKCIVTKLIDEIETENISIYYLDYIKPIKNAVIKKDIDLIRILSGKFLYDLKTIKEIKFFSIYDDQLSKMFLTDDEKKFVDDIILNFKREQYDIEKRYVNMCEKCNLYEYLFIYYVLYGNCPVQYFVDHCKNTIDYIKLACIFKKLNVVELCLNLFQVNELESFIPILIRNNIQIGHIDVIIFMILYMTKKFNKWKMQKIITNSLVEIVLTNEIKLGKPMKIFVNYLIKKYDFDSNIDDIYMCQYSKLQGKGIIVSQ